MGRYVYLEDEETTSILETRDCIGNKGDWILPSVVNKLTKKSKKLESYKYKKVSNIQYEITTDIKYRTIFYNRYSKEIELNGFIYEIEELETIMNKAKELFEGYKNV